jgi:hypothetical protein
MIQKLFTNAVENYSTQSGRPYHSISYGVNYDDTPVNEGLTEKRHGTTLLLLQTSIAPSGMQMKFNFLLNRKLTKNGLCKMR